ncbi:MAG: GDP-mannose 4,6-dehydratase [Burkholderiaceae bacterium]|nr:GDP-mannose 4,6-dehydratase [Burkholderiaceae bacterium]
MNEAIAGNRYLLSGGASLVGSHLADALLAAGAAEVRLFDNLSLGTPETIAHLANDKRVTVIRGDILRLNELIDAAQGVQGVYALAGFLTLPLSQNPPLGVAVNTMGMINTLEASRIAGVKRVVFASSLSAYGNTTGDSIQETTPFGVDGLPPASAMYGSSKVLGESIGFFYQQKHNIEFNALRFSSIYGERQHLRAVNALYIVQAYEQIRQGKAPVIIGDGKEVHDYIHVADIADACVAAMSSRTSGQMFNVCTGVDTTLTEVVDILLDIAGRRDIKPEYRADTRTVRSSSVNRLNISRAKAEKLLGWTPKVGVREGIARLIKWREQQG